jgi:hypothetical protein
MKGNTTQKKRKYEVRKNTDRKDGSKVRNGAYRTPKVDCCFSKN